MATVPVTGGGGFIGSRVVAVLVADGWAVRVLDSAPPEWLPDGVDYRRGDLADEGFVTDAARGADAVTHHGAKVGLEQGVADMVELVRANDLGTAPLLRALDCVDFRGRLVLAASIVVYGEGSYRCPQHGAVRPAPRPEHRLSAGCYEPTCPRRGADVEGEPIGEDAAPEPRSVYAATKLHQEHLCGVLARQRAVPYLALRDHNAYGRGMPHDTSYAGVAALFAFGAGAPRPVVRGGNRPGDVRHVVASPRRAGEVLGFEASVTLAEGMADFATTARARPRVG